MFSTRETCLASLDFFKQIHGVDVPLTDWAQTPVLEGQTSIEDFLTTAK